MLKSIEIIDNTKSPIRYLCDLPTFENGRTYEFKSGINVIVGPNGSGKSTLLKLVEMFTFCEHTMVTRVPNKVIEYPHVFKDNCFGDDDGGVLDGVRVHHDYRSTVFRYHPSMEMNDIDILGSFESFGTYMKGTAESTGEKTINALNSLYGVMFSKDTDLKFPIEELTEVRDEANSVWKKRLGNLLKYYEDNKCKVKKEDFEFTVLIDEPDRNLDISNIETIYNICSTQKPQTQVIYVLHNPIILYKLSKLDYVNFIEMEDGYMDSVKRLIENI